MTQDESINYSGPPKEWTPLPQAPTVRPQNTRMIDREKYADIDLLRRNLAILEKESLDTVNIAEESLRSFNLGMETDSDLYKAQEAEWPSELGEMKNYVTYAQYKVMGERTSRGSNYVLKEYNNAIRGVWGSPAADVASFSRKVHSEAVRIQNFLDTYISEGSNETSQDRAIELLQDWTLGAITRSGQFRGVFAAKDEAQTRYSQSDLDEASPAESRRYQAILQVQLNQAAASVQELQEDMGKHLGVNADLYYDGYLGPALKFRRQISSDVGNPIRNSGKLAREMHQATEVLDDNAKVFLSDLMKRNQIFTEKSGKLLARIGESDIRRKTIKDLSLKGSVPVNPFVSGESDVEIIDYYEIEYDGWLYEQQEQATPSYSNPAFATTTRNRFKSQHGALADVGKMDAHPQYLLRDGGSVIGDMYVADGVRIDGVDISSHQHNGTDGSALINGANITPGTLPTAAFDNGDNLDDIADFQLLGYNTTVSLVTGDTSYEATIGWVGEDGKQFEIQVARVT